jgi:uncharacterized RDD family membrane protein YckC
MTTTPGDPGRGRKTPAKLVTLGAGQTMVLAEYGQRFRARLSDSFLIGIGLVIAATGWSLIFLYYLFGSGSFSESESLDAAVTFWALIIFSPLLLYEIVAVAWRGRTLGMKAVGLRVVSIGSGQKPSPYESLLRGGLPVCLYPFLLPVLFSEADTFVLLAAACWWLLVNASVFWGKDRRGWHDLISGTVVVTAAPPVSADALQPPVESAGDDRIHTGPGDVTADGGDDNDAV